ncbi:NACHT domain-containing protein [Lentzea sp. NPDC054927]
MTGISTVVAAMAQTAVAWVHESPTPIAEPQLHRVEGYLRGPDCASLFELLCQLENTESGEFHHAQERAELAQAFQLELVRAVGNDSEEARAFASSLWDLIELNAPARTHAVDPQDKIVIAVTGPERPIAERLALAVDLGRRTESARTGEVVRAAMGQAYERMVMPHSKADFRFPTERIYVPRNVCRKDARGDLGTLTSEDSMTDRRFVLVGNPGAGKSTFIRRLIHRAAAEGARVPLLVQLKRHQEIVDDFVTIIARELRPLTQRVVPRQHIADLLDTGAGLVVFDGLDEVGDIHSRRASVVAIEAFAARFPLAHIVVTCREESYPVAMLDAVKFPVHWLPDFDSDQVEYYARMWFSLVHGVVDGGESRAAAFLRDSAHVLDLRSNPLMLSLLCMLYQSEGYIPENTADVYRECSELMLVRWDSVSQVPSVIRSSVKLAKFLVQELAQHFFFTLGGQGDEGETTLLRLVVAHLREREEEGARSYHQQARDFLDYCAERAWVLTQVDTSLDGERRFGFTHRTFMEYYTACYVLRTCESSEQIAGYLLPMITSGKSSVVPQIALQMYDVNRADGGDACVRLFLEDVRRRPDVGAELAVVTFCVTFLEHNNIRRSTAEALLEHAFGLLGRTGDRFLYSSLRAVRFVKRTGTATVARAILARTASQRAARTDLRQGAGMVVRVPAAAYEADLGEARHSLMKPGAFVARHGVASLVYALLPGEPVEYVAGPVVKAIGDGRAPNPALKVLAPSWRAVLPLPRSALPAIIAEFDRVAVAHLVKTFGFGLDGFAGLIAVLGTAAFEANVPWQLPVRLLDHFRVPVPAAPSPAGRLAFGERMRLYSGEGVEMEPVRELLLSWKSGHVSFVAYNA